MNDQPCDLTFSKQTAPGQLEIIRIEAKDGPQILARIDMSLADFASALMGREIIAAFSPVRAP